MNFFENFNPKETKKLFGLAKEFNFIKQFILSNKLPNVLMLSGEKGIGKFTLTNHLINYYFNRSLYDESKKEIIDNKYFTQMQDSIFPNVIYVNGKDFINVKIEDIRNLKNRLTKTPILNTKRFIILDDAENFNINSLNALLKVLEDPGKNNFFFLINNKSKPMLDTIKSRCIEIKIFFSIEKKQKNTSLLIDFFNQDICLDFNLVKLSPGNFLKYNLFFKNSNINFNENLILNLNKLLAYYKKERNTYYKDLIIFFIEYYFELINSNKEFKKSDFKKKSDIIRCINNYFIYNLNQSSLINSINSKFCDK